MKIMKNGMMMEVNMKKMIMKMMIMMVKMMKWLIFFRTSPFRDRVANLRGPSEGLGGNAANV